MVVNKAAIHSSENFCLRSCVNRVSRAQFYKKVPSRKAPTGAIGTAHSLFYKIGLREGHQLWLVHSRAHQPELMPFPQSWCLSPKRLVYTCLAGRAPTIVGAFGKTHFYKIELSDANVSWGRAPTFRMFPPKFFSENVPSRRHQLAPSGKANFYKIGPRAQMMVEWRSETDEILCCCSADFGPHWSASQQAENQRTLVVRACNLI